MKMNMDITQLEQPFGYFFNWSRTYMDEYVSSEPVTGDIHQCKLVQANFSVLCTGKGTKSNTKAKNVLVNVGGLKDKNI